MVRMITWLQTMVVHLFWKVNLRKYCIRCGACLNTCPAYRQIGGHGYGSIYPGPILIGNISFIGRL